MKKTLLALAVLCAFTAAQAQTIKADTLQDLKAEMEYQLKMTLSADSDYSDAMDKFAACVTKMVSELLGTDCRVESRDTGIYESISAARLEKYGEAREVYERELRKVERKKE